jgi:hypothetical protein
MQRPVYQLTHPRGCRYGLRQTAPPFLDWNVELWLAEDCEGIAEPERGRQRAGSRVVIVSAACEDVDTPQSGEASSLPIGHAGRLRPQISARREACVVVHGSPSWLGRASTFLRASLVSGLLYPLLPFVDFFAVTTGLAVAVHVVSSPNQSRNESPSRI